MNERVDTSNVIEIEKKLKDVDSEDEELQPDGTRVKKNEEELKYHESIISDIYNSMSDSEEDDEEDSEKQLHEQIQEETKQKEEEIKKQKHS